MSQIYLQGRARARLCKPRPNIEEQIYTLYGRGVKADERGECGKSEIMLPGVGEVKHPIDAVGAAGKPAAVFV